MNPREYKTVTVYGLTWAVMSRNERCVTHAGRHFFAVRCNPKRAWHIHEHDCDIAQTGSAKPLLVFTNDYETHHLSDAVREICGADGTYCCQTCFTVFRLAFQSCPACGEQRGEAHPSMPFEQHRAAMKARHAAHAGAATE